MGRPQVESRTETLPYSWYADPAVAAAEREQIFRRSWQYVGHLGELDGPGSMFPTQVGGLPLVVVLDREGELRAFLNVCRHRGTVLVDEPQRRGTIQCPYHAWTYGLDGSLRGAPRSKEEPDFDMDCLGLVPAQVGTLGPVRVREPGHGRAGTGRRARRPPRGGRRERPRRGLAPLPRPRRIRDQRELEDRDRELPRVLPLPAEPPGLREGDRRAAAADGGGRAAPQPVPAGASRRLHRRRALRRERHRAHGAVPHPLPGDEVQREPGPAEPVDRPAVAGGHRPHRGLVRPLLPGGHRRGLDRGDAGVRQPGRRRRTRASSRRCSAAPRAGRSSTAACSPAPRR